MEASIAASYVNRLFHHHQLTTTTATTESVAITTTSGTTIRMTVTSSNATQRKENQAKFDDHTICSILGINTYKIDADEVNPTVKQTNIPVCDDETTNDNDHEDTDHQFPIGHTSITKRALNQNKRWRQRFALNVNKEMKHTSYDDDINPPK